MNLELVDLKRQFAPLRDEVLTAVEEVLGGMHLYLGEQMQRLEEEFAAYCGTDDAIAVGSGTDALYLALRAQGIGPGDEVITVSHTFVATANAIRLAGATPVFVDIDPATYTMDPDAAAAAVTPRTAAILPVHLYGQMAAMDAITAIARRHGLFLLEDACQAHGARQTNVRAGAAGDAGAFSFYYSKNLGAYGEGGIVTTSDPALARRVRLLRNHGSEQRYSHEIVGTNSRLDELQAAILRVKLRHLDAWNGARARLADAYRQRLRDLPRLGLPAVPDGNEHVYHLFVVRCPERDEVQSALRRRGIASGVHYPVPVHLQQAYADLDYPPGSLPQTEAAAGEVLSLPMFPELTEAEVDLVTSTIREALAAPSGEIKETSGATLP